MNPASDHRSNLHKLATKRRILLLQGPVGDFFYCLAQWFRQQGAHVFKINFNGGDEYYYPANTAGCHTFDAAFEQFPAYLDHLLRSEHIDAVVCFGDTRFYHKAAKQCCQMAGISFWAFEEGYFRPYWVTLEEQGVNAYSPLPRDAAFFQAALPKLAQQTYDDPPEVPVGFWPVAVHSIRYYTVMHRQWKRFPHYLHHRASSIPYYIKCWVCSAWRREWYRLREAGLARAIRHGAIGRFFIFPLQVATDSQICVHSSFKDTRECLDYVLRSFAIHAPADTTLIIKHHPMDRGFINYRKQIERFLHSHPTLKSRIHYVHDIPLPVFLRNGAGMVTVNSTSGLSALIHNMPVKLLGQANYNIAGITSQQKLADFWKQPEAPKPQLFHAWRMYHIHHTQINGSFYSRVNLPEHP